MASMYVTLLKQSGGFFSGTIQPFSGIQVKLLPCLDGFALGLTGAWRSML